MASEPTLTPRQRATVASIACGVALLCLALVVDRAFFANGITVAWWTTDREGERYELVRTVEHRVSFPNHHRAQARMVEHWDHHRSDPPMSPGIDAVVLAHVTIPPGAPHFIGAVGTGIRTISIDGRPIDEHPIEPGEHWLEVAWREAVPGVASRLELTAGTEHDPLEPMPRSWLTPSMGAWPTSRWLFVLASLALAALLASLAGRLAFLEDTPRMRLAEKGAMAMVVLVAVLFRGFDLDVMPYYGENGDELFALWNGWSILNDGVPRGWSLWPGGYGAGSVEMTTLATHGQTWTVIEPYFEHPPTLHLLVGIAATLGGAEHYSHARLSDGRVVALLLSTFAVWLVMRITKRLEGRLDRPSLAPVFAGLLYACLPMIVLQSRSIKEESLLIPLMLASTLAFLRWRDDGQRTRDAVIAALLAGMCMPTKVTGFAMVLALVALFVFEQRPKVAALAAGIGGALAGLFPLFGALVNWSTFVETQRLQGGRPTHFNLFLRFFDDGMINHTLIGRGWMLFLWIGCLLALARIRRRDVAAVMMPPLFYMAAIGLGSGNWTFGWYVTPLLPFLCVGAGTFLRDLVREPDFLRGALFTLTAVMYGFNFLLDPHEAKQPPAWPGLRTQVTVLLALMLGPYALVQVFPKLRSLGRAVTYAWVLVLVALSANFVVHYDVFYERYRDFDRDTYFDR